MRYKWFFFVFTVVVWLIVGCSHKSILELVSPHYVHPPSTTTTVVTPDPPSRYFFSVLPGVNNVTGNFPSSCTSQANGELPDPLCTPGSVRSDVDSNHLELTVCKSGWSESVLPPRNDFAYAKTRLMKAYGDPPNKRPVTELDHKIPRSLGGSNDVTNLWPEVSDLPGSGFANKKDKVEKRLHLALCNGELTKHGHTLRDAQIAINNNWMTAEQVLDLAA